MMGNYLNIGHAVQNLSDILSPYNNESGKDNWWECSTYIDMSNFEVLLHYEKCPPDKDGGYLVTETCSLIFPWEEVIIKLKANNLYELENPMDSIDET